jgi:two-component system cell cycle sensor histidine kinase/response regulator CckA
MVEENEGIEKTSDFGARHRRVLVVEDDEGLRNLVLKALRKAGHEADGVVTGTAAIERVVADPGLVLLLDQKLPDMTGSDIINALNEHGLRVPFIVMTGQGDERLAVEMMKLGAADYLVKTLDLVDLLPGVFQRLFRELDNERRLRAASARLRESEDKLAKSYERLTSILDSLDALVYVADFNSCEILFINKYGREIWGDVQGRKCWQTIQKDQDGPCSFCTNDRLLSDSGFPTGVYQWEFQNTANGRWYECRDQAIFWIGKALVRMEIATDITDRKQAEEEKRILQERIQRLEKMETLGNLAGGVAHNLNNILGILVGYSELLSHEIDKNSPLRKHIQTIMNSGEQAAAVVQDLLTLTRRGVVIRQTANLNRIVHDQLKTPELLKLTLSHRIELHCEEDLLNIKGSAEHVSKTLTNLVMNAAEAMPEGGVISIRTENRRLDRPLAGYEEVQKGDYVVLSVSDTGSGISIDDLKHIFEPFFTRKVMGRSGSGLGLSVVWGTMKDHDGYVDVTTAKGKGTTFTLYFPVTPDEFIGEETISVNEYKGKGVG